MKNPEQILRERAAHQALAQMPVEARVAGALCMRDATALDLALDEITRTMKLDPRFAFELDAQARQARDPESPASKAHWQWQNAVGYLLQEGQAAWRGAQDAGALDLLASRHNPGMPSRLERQLGEVFQALFLAGIGSSQQLALGLPMLGSAGQRLLDWGLDELLSRAVAAGEPGRQAWSLAQNFVMSHPFLVHQASEAIMEAWLGAEREKEPLVSERAKEGLMQSVLRDGSPKALETLRRHGVCWDRAHPGHVYQGLEFIKKQWLPIASPLSGAASDSWTPEEKSQEWAKSAQAALRAIEALGSFKQNQGDGLDAFLPQNERSLFWAVCEWARFGQSAGLDASEGAKAMALSLQSAGFGLDDDGGRALFHASREALAWRATAEGKWAMGLDLAGPKLLLELGADPAACGAGLIAAGALWQGDAKALARARPQWLIFCQSLGIDPKNAPSSGPLGRCALGLALGRSDLAFALELVKRGHPLDWSDPQTGESLLSLCALRGAKFEPLAAQIAKDLGARALVNQFASGTIECEKHERSTALMRASFLQNEKMVNILLDAGADPNLQDGNGMTALAHAGRKFGAKAQAKALGVVKALLGAGADPAIADAKGRTPAQAMAAKGPLGPLAELLALRPQDVCGQDAQSKQALAKLAKRGAHAVAVVESAVLGESLDKAQRGPSSRRSRL